MVMENFVRQFKDEGYFTSLELFSPSEIKSICSIIDRIEAGEIDFPRHKIEHDPNNPSRLRKINDLAENDSFFFNFAKNQKIIELVKKCIGKDIKLFGDQLFMKPPGGIEKTRHQDSPYFPIEPMELISCWIALDNVTEQNGCMWLIPKSHFWGAIEHSEKWMVGTREDMCIPEKNLPDFKEIPILLKSGSASFHHSLIVHRSGANKTKQPRRGWAIHYMSSKSRWTGDIDSKPDFKLINGKSFPGCV